MLSDSNYEKYQQLVFSVLFIIIDLALWIGIGLVILNYEDFYDES